MDKIVFASIDVPISAEDFRGAVFGRGGVIPTWFYRDIDGTREIAVTGVLVPRGNEDYYVTGYDWIESALVGVDRVRLFIDSPGGILHQSLERIMKRLQSIDSEAIVTGVCASAAWLLARSCRRLYASGDACEIGGIGAYIVVYDLTELHKQNGLKPIRISTGKLKGIGANGEYTEEEIAELKRQVDAVFNAYIGVLGRPLDSGLYDGRVYISKEAMTLGLIDGILNSVTVEDDRNTEMEYTTNPDDQVVEGNEEKTEMSAEDVIINDCDVKSEEVEVADEVTEEFEDDVEEEEEEVEKAGKSEKTKTHVKLPVRRVSEDFSAERLFEKLVAKTGSRAQAWITLERINHEAYVRLRSKKQN